MNNTQDSFSQTIIPLILAIIFVTLLLVAIYYREISHWLYVREMWILPIQIK